jgi:hypothetical protein
VRGAELVDEPLDDALVPVVTTEVVVTAAAVGSLMMRSTLRPAIVPASLVAWRWESLK